MKILGFEIKRSSKPVAQNSLETQSTEEMAESGLNRVKEALEPDFIELATRVYGELAAKASKALDEGTEALPTKGGRSSVPSDSVTFGSLLSEFGSTMPDFPVEVYRVLENLGMWNSDVSYAIDNIVQLGNTEYTITFDDGVPEQMQKDMRLQLKLLMKRVYSFSEGMNGLITDLLAQLTMCGVISAEICPEDDLMGVKKAVLVAPSTIRFKYDRVADEHAPYQVVNGLTGLSSTANLGMVKLNTETYKYIALRRFNDKPYGIPPFLAAFENICIEKDMVRSIKTVVKKLGVMGFLQVLLTQPKMQAGETAAQYQTRAKNYLLDMLPEVEKGFANGIVVGFDGTHKFDVASTNTNVTGAKDLMELNTTMKMSGLKQDPLMLGRNYSTTETLARVILAKLSTQVGNSQKKVASFMESLFYMHLGLLGHSIKYVEVEFAPPMVADKLRDEQAYNWRIKNADALYNNGTIDQVQRAQYLGYDEPAEEEPRFSGLMDSGAIGSKEEAPAKEDTTKSDDDPKK